MLDTVVGIAQCIACVGAAQHDGDRAAASVADRICAGTTKEGVRPSATD